MRSFWSYISDGAHAVGCTGGSVCVYDAEGGEVAVFRGLRYAYLPLLSPDGELLAVKSTEGMLAVYSLREMRLLRKFRFSPADGAQDDNMCFSPDGKLLYNIEDATGRGDTRITAYETAGFTSAFRLFEGEEVDPRCLECAGGQIYLLGDSGESGARRPFTAVLQGECLREMRYVSEKDAGLCYGFLHLRNAGFTKKAKQWSSLQYEGSDLTDIEARDYSIARLWRDGSFRGK